MRQITGIRRFLGQGIAGGGGEDTEQSGVPEPPLTPVLSAQSIRLRPDGRSLDASSSDAHDVGVVDAVVLHELLRRGCGECSTVKDRPRHTRAFGRSEAGCQIVGGLVLIEVAEGRVP